jgi:hypothetical protein
MGAIAIHQMNDKIPHKIHEVYVWMNGKLIYKKWMDTKQSMVFDKMTYGKDTLVSITDDEDGNVVIKKN